MNEIPSESKTISEACEVHRPIIIGILIVLQKLNAAYSNPLYNGNIDVFIDRIKQNQELDLPEGRSREVALSFLEEFNKLEKTEEGHEVVKLAMNFFKIAFAQRQVLIMSGFWTPEAYLNEYPEHLAASTEAIIAASKRLDEGTQLGIKTKFLTAFYTATQQPALILAEIPPEILFPRAPIFFGEIGAMMLRVGVTVGLVYESTRNWNDFKKAYHAMGRHPEISAPVGIGIALFLALAAYAYYKSRPRVQEIPEYKYPVRPSTV